MQLRAHLLADPCTYVHTIWKGGFKNSKKSVDVIYENPLKGMPTESESGKKGCGCGKVVRTSDVAPYLSKAVGFHGQLKAAKLHSLLLPLPPPLPPSLSLSLSCCSEPETTTTQSRECPSLPPSFLPSPVSWERLNPQREGNLLGLPRSLARAAEHILQVARAGGAKYRVTQ